MKKDLNTHQQLVLDFFQRNGGKSYTVTEVSKYVFPRNENPEKVRVIINVLKDKQFISLVLDRKANRYQTN